MRYLGRDSIFHINTKDKVRVFKLLFVNLLTLTRFIAIILLSLIMCTSYNENYNKYFIVIVMITIYIFISDFIDGKLARRWNCCSDFGAKFDILADLFYIFSQDIILIYFKKMKCIIIILILIEFMVFIATSHIRSRFTGNKKVFFDKIGRITACLYYSMPLLYIILDVIKDYLIQGRIKSIINVIFYILTLLSIISRIQCSSKRV